MKAQATATLWAVLFTAAAHGQLAAPAPQDAQQPTPAAQPLPLDMPAPDQVHDVKTVPQVERIPINEGRVRTIHLRYGITTAIKTPLPVTTIAIGDPYLFEAEHSAEEPTILLVKPRTHEACNSNLVVVLENGTALSFSLASTGDGIPNDPVDFMLELTQGQSLFKSSAGTDLSSSGKAFSGGSLPGAPDQTDDVRKLLLATLRDQSHVATPAYRNAKELTKEVKANESAPDTLAVALGAVRQSGDHMIVSYSVMNISNILVEVMPAQVQYSNPHAKKPKKGRGARAEQIPVNQFLTTERKLQPGQRCDGVITFDRPNFKQFAERLLLQVASASAVDYPLMVPIPFVAPGPDPAGKE